jgi:hypothetical protein
MDIEPESPEQLDTSEELDLVTVFSVNHAGAEMEAMMIRGLLEAGGIPAVIVSTSEFPSLPFEVRVPRAQVDVARRLVTESEAAGPQGAEEAEESTEGQGRL